MVFCPKRDTGQFSDDVGVSLFRDSPFWATIFQKIGLKQIDAAEIHSVGWDQSTKLNNETAITVRCLETVTKSGVERDVECTRTDGGRGRVWKEGEIAMTTETGNLWEGEEGPQGFCFAHRP